MTARLRRPPGSPGLCRENTGTCCHQALAERTVKDVRDTLRAALANAVAEELLARNVAAVVRLPAPKETAAPVVVRRRGWCVASCSIRATTSGSPPAWSTGCLRTTTGTRRDNGAAAAKPAAPVVLVAGGPVPAFVRDGCRGAPPGPEPGDHCRGRTHGPRTYARAVTRLRDPAIPDQARSSLHTHAPLDDRGQFRHLAGGD
jgi:hypothetical protein